MSESTVRSFNPAVILNQFFDTIFGEQKGWAYTATKEPQEDKKGDWEKKFFKYPEQKEEMIEFIITSSASKDVYYSPALYKSDRSEETITKEDFYGTCFVWADFDGGLPDEEKLAKVPKPTLKIRSSEGQRQHWYWNLNFCETDPDALEKITRALTYHLGADLSGWDYQQVLRPPGTIHHGSGKTVTILEHDKSHRVSIEAFMDIPEVPDYIWDVDINEKELEPPSLILFQYKMPKNHAQLILKKEQPVGKRSSALMAVGYACAEAGMNNTEIYSVIKNCDMRWKKFVNRGEQGQKKQLISIIRRVRQKFPLRVKDEIEDALPYFKWGEFASMDIKVEWIVPGLIQKNGIPFITGLAGVFKTHLTFNLACHMVLGKKFLHWEFSRPMTLCIISNELSPPETKEQLELITQQFSEEEQMILAKNLHIIPLGARLPLNKPKVQNMLLQRLEQFGPEGLFFDSLGQSIDESPNSDDIVNGVFDFIKRRVNQQYDAFSWFIHHNRKAQIGNKKPKDLSDLYGSAYIANNASLVLNLWKDAPSSSIAEADYLKVRFDRTPDSFKLKRLSPVGFELVSNNYVDLSLTREQEDDSDGFKSLDF